MAKGDLAWDTIGKMILGLVFLLIIILVIYAFREKLSDMLAGLKRGLRFGF